MSLAENLAKVREKINCDTTLVCVSKKKPANLIAEAYKLGCRDFGENYVQELLEKRKEIDLPDVRWHFIGGLQSNKVKKLVGKVDLIHSVDRLSVVNEVSKRAKSEGIIQKILLQVNVSGEESKSGVSASELKDLLSRSLELEGVKVCGLMGFGAYVPVEESESKRAQQFIELCKIRDSMQNLLGAALPELSMGVSHDFDLAVKYGASIVRVGSAIFGERE